MARWIQDGGHGGTDPGAIANGIQEKFWSLEASLYVNSRLNELGIESVVSRDRDISLTNKERTNIVKQYERCVSHHFNAGGGVGVEMIHSIFSDGVFENLLLDEFKKTSHPIRNTPIYTRKNSRGLDYYYMNRETGKCKTTILEYDFLDGGNVAKLREYNYRTSLYECVIKAICNYEGKKYHKPSKDTEYSDNSTYYRVVTGSFKDKVNADHRVEELKKVGYESFITIFKS